MVEEWLVCEGDGSKSNEERKRRLGGSTLERRFVYREHEGGGKRLFYDYFVADPIFDDATFQYKYRMQRGLFIWLVDVTM